MQISRRAAGLASCLGLLSATLPRAYGDQELAKKLRTIGRVTGLAKADLPTPALLLDLDIFEKNLAKMAKHAASNGKQLRPHAKTHKCVEVVRRQEALGAIGVCVATVNEAEVMATGGIDGILLASPIATPSKSARMAGLAVGGRNVIVAVDHAQQVSMYELAAAKAGSKLGVLIDLDVGDHRTGIEPDELALKLAELVTKSKQLELRGVQAYSGGSSHVIGFAQRRNHSLQAMSRAAAMRERFRKSGLPSEILSGTSTGTYNIDSEIEQITELQVGSYVAMDVDYRRIGGMHSDVFNDFGHALTVLATVVSANYRKQVTIDAGFKALATDRPFGPDLKDHQGIRYLFRGDEFGVLSWETESTPFQLGDRLELLAPHCDPTVNLYDRIYACRRDQVEEIWSVMDRLSATQEGNRPS